MQAKLSIQPGEYVLYSQSPHLVTAILDLQHVLVKCERNNHISKVKISELKPLTPVQSAPQTLDLAEISDDDWKIAQSRLSYLQPILSAPKKTAQLVKQQAELAGVHSVTLYRWMKAYKQELRLSALLPTKKNGGKGKPRLSDDVEALMVETINEFYLSVQKPSVQKTYNELKRRCINANLNVPHSNTLRNRIQIISEKEKVKKRIGSKAIQELYVPSLGENPEGLFPLSSIQIDHTPLDIILVDDIDRLPIGRPWITVAIDVFSRMVAGFYISFDPPSAMSTGLCLVQAILPKEEYLAKMNIETLWPIWGKPKAVHCDNAKEFRGAMLDRACNQYKIDIHWRPVARPHYGGHIERLLGTFNQEIHTLPGTTFSNTQQRDNYPSEKKSALTFSELEQWLTLYITNVYHQRFHSSINTTPLKMYEKGILGDENKPGRGLPEIITDQTRLKLDLMPFEERTVQSYGIKINEITYFHDVLRPWVNAKDPENIKLKRKFLIRQDPRDISIIFFYDPELQQYFEVPYRDRSYPPITLWEYKKIRKRLKEEGKNHVDETLIFNTYNEMKTIEEQAVKTTLKVRRSQQRKRNNQAAKKTQLAQEPKAIIEHEMSTDDSADFVDFFDDIDIG